MENCNKCNEVKIVGCGCQKPTNCGCGKKVDLKCTVYTGVTLEPLHIADGMNGEQIIKIINDYLKDLIIDLDIEPTILQNVGSGFELYKGFSGDRRHEIRTLLKGDGIIIEEVNENELLLKVDKTFIENNTKITINNVGIGEDVFKAKESDIYKFRRLKSSDGTVNINVVDDNDSLDITAEIPEVDYPVIESEDVGSGTSLRRDLVGKKIGIKTLSSPDIIVTEDVEGGIVIKLAGGGSTSNDWYIDVNFQRPSNWNTPQNNKEKITYLSSMSEIASGIWTNGQEIPVPLGTLNDPFKSYEEYLLKRIYGFTGSSVGTPSKVNPRYPILTLQILSDVTTASDLEVNNTSLKMKNNSVLLYTGTREYAFDYKSIYDAMPTNPDGSSQLTMNNYISGEGRITRKTGFGLIRAKAGTKTTYGTPAIVLTGEGDNGITLEEGLNEENFVPVFKKDGITRLVNGNFPVSGWIQAPVTPLIVIERQGTGWWASMINGTKVFIITKTQVGIELIGTADLTSSADKLMYQVSNQFIGYEKILLDTVAYTTEERALVNTYGQANTQNPGIFYKPYSSYSIFKAGEGTVFRIENLSTEPNAFNNFKAMNTFEQANKSDITIIVSFSDIGGGGTLNLLKKYGSTGYFTMNNGSSSNYYYNLAEGDGTNKFVINLQNMKLSSKNYKSNFNTFNILANGTLTTINGYPILNILPSYDNNTLALVDLLPGMLYRNNLNGGAVTQVV